MFNKEMIMIGLRDPNLEDRLEQLAKETGRSKSYYVRLAIQQFLEDREDYLLGLARLEKSSKRFTLKDVEKHLDVDS
jgi:RHH-type rel operon transcriptional repressor/antitoxin RelB